MGTSSEFWYFFRCQTILIPVKRWKNGATDSIREMASWGMTIKSTIKMQYYKIISGATHSHKSQIEMQSSMISMSICLLHLGLLQHSDSRNTDLLLLIVLHQGPTLPETEDPQIPTGISRNQMFQYWNSYVVVFCVLNIVIYTILYAIKKSCFSCLRSKSLRANNVSSNDKVTKSSIYKLKPIYAYRTNIQ